MSDGCKISRLGKNEMWCPVTSADVCCVYTGASVTARGEQIQVILAFISKLNFYH